VYNHEYDVLRPVTITPSRSWGGGGLLGCVLGFGALHRIPPPLNEPPNAPGETMFEAARVSNEDGRPGSAVAGGVFSPSTNVPAEYNANYLVPANAQYGNPSPPSGAGAPPQNSSTKSGRKGRSPHGAAALNMDDYFKEEEAKSKELEGTPASKPSGSSLPPPPKTGGGGPPRASASPSPALSSNEA
jgi:hypothetical protein